MNTTIANILKTFDSTEDEIRIFTCLLTEGELTVSELSEKTNIKRTTVYGLVTKLQSKGLIIEIIKSDVKKLQIISKEKLIILYEQKIDELKKCKDSIENVFTVSSTKTIKKPKLEMYYGKEGVQYVLQDMLLKRNIVTEAVWPIKQMLKVLGGTYFEYLNKERIKRNLYTKALWPEDQIVDTTIYPYLGSGKEFMREIKILPKEIDFDMGYWIYGDRVAFVSSEKEMYGFIVSSKELTDVLRKQFNILWNLSSGLKQTKSKEVDEFLKNIYS
jgi:sugar-specific transcriptional regulator TrmB